MAIEVWLRDSDMLGVRATPYDNGFAGVMADAPQKYWHPTTDGSVGWWRMPITEPNMRFIASTIIARYSKDVELGDGVRQIIAHALLEAKMLDVKAKRIAEYTFSQEAPTILDYEFKTTPFKHQVVGFDACRGTDAFALFMEMGTGKTKTSVDRACYDLIKKCKSLAKACSPLPSPEDKSVEAANERRDGVMRVLVLCPKSILQNWGREFKTHATVPFAFGAMRGASDERIEAILQVMKAPERLKIVACNYDALHKWKDLLKACKFHLVIADESTRIKTPKARRTQMAIEVARGCENRMILSGQPITKNVLDLFCQFQFLVPDGAPLGYDNFTAFSRRYTEPDPWAPQKRIPRNVEELKQKVARFSFIVKKKECLDLPDKTYVVENIEMAEEQAALYKKLRDQLMAELLSDSGSSGRISIKHVLTKFLRLAQVTSGFIPLDSEVILDAEGNVVSGDKGNREIKEFSPNPKLERLVEVIDDCVDQNDEEGSKVIVWSRFIHDIKSIERELQKVNIPSVSFYGETKEWEKEAAIRNFNENDSVRVFIGQPQSGGLGLTLIGSKKCPTTLEAFYSNDFNLESRLQAEDRAHRIGMHVPVTIMDFCCSGTIDVIMRNRLLEKKGFADDFTDAKSIAAAFLGPDAGL